MQAIQDIAFKDGTCFGCGPVNPHGLRIKSFWSDDGKFVIATFQPRPELNAGIPNVLYGGTVASLIDCHSNWTAIAATYRMEGRDPLKHCRSVHDYMREYRRERTPRDQVRRRDYRITDQWLDQHRASELGEAKVVSTRDDQAGQQRQPAPLDPCRPTA
jgi:hypothetical protein